MNEGPVNETSDWLLEKWIFSHHLDGWDIWLENSGGGPYKLLAVPAEGADHWVGYMPGQASWGASYGDTRKLPESVRTVGAALARLLHQ